MHAARAFGHCIALFVMLGLAGPVHADGSDAVGTLIDVGRETAEIAVELAAARNDLVEPARGSVTPPSPWDYSRFSDGPRRVPKPRGASMERARSLGLGTLETAQHLLSRAPKPEWIRAARGKATPSLLWPVENGRFGRGFGFVREERRNLRHNGIDVAAEEGAVVRAVADGIVAYSDNGIRGFGNCVLIVHPNGWVSVYAHNQRTTVQPGWRVQRGERIAFVGHTGIARGPHLHFELRVNGRPTDPRSLFSKTTTHAIATASPPAREPEVPPAPPMPPAEASPALSQPTITLPLGDLAFVRTLLSSAPPPELLATIEGRSFPNLLWPVRGGSLVRSFAPEHRGIDIGAEEGTAVRAAADGIVAYAGDALAGLGKTVILVHPNGWVTLYGSNQELAVTPGQHVLRGEWIAKVGATGSADGAHLHFEIYKLGTAEDPLPLLVQQPDFAAAMK